MTAWKAPLPKAAAIVLAALVVYLPALGGGLVWDDSTHLNDGRGSLRRLWLTTEPLDYFPVTGTSFWIEWRLWGPDPLGYHVTNVLLHGAAAVLLWLALERLRVPGAWLAGMIFAVHPVNVASVAWISEQKNTLSLLFAAASLLAWLRYDDSLHHGDTMGAAPATNDALQSSILSPQSSIWFYALSVALFLLALLSKTSVAMLPAALLGCAWWRRGRISRRDLLRTAPFFALSIGLGLATVWFQSHRAMAGQPPEMLSLVHRIGAAGAAVWFYLLKALAPVRLCAIYPGWGPKEIAEMPLWPALLLAGLLALFVKFHRTWGRPFLFGLGYYVVMLLPVLGFANMYVLRMSLVWDHFQYPALIGVIALAVGLAANGIERSRSRLGRLAPFAAGALVAVLGLHTWQQAKTYRSEIALWTDVLDKNKESWTAYNNLAAAHIQLGTEDDAALALAYARSAAILKPDHANAYFNIGRARLLLNEPEKALAPLREAIRIWPQFAEAHAVLADALLRAGEPEEALAQYRESLKIQDDAAVRYRLADALVKRDLLDEAAENYEALLREEPGFAAAHNNLARVLAAQGKLAEAVAHYRAALKLMPDSPLVLDNLAWVEACSAEARVRDGADATRLAEHALRLAGEKDVKALDTLAAACAEMGRFDDAVRLAGQALKAATEAGQKARAERIAGRLKLYESRRPVREGPGIPIE